MSIIASVVGARPNFIKLKVVYDELNKLKGLTHVVIHTGQHYDYEMSSVFFKEFDLPEPDYFLNVGSGSHGFQTGEMLKRVEEVLMRESPNLVLVYGDTNTTLAGALAAVKLRMPVAHVEAGLRSGEMYMPEEVNRVIVDHVSELLFVPTPSSRKNLERESVKGRIVFTGDVMLDLYLRFKDKLGSRAKEMRGDYMIVTLHRAENVDNYHRLEAILKALSESGHDFIFPMHPRTKRRIKEFGLERYLGDNIQVVKPLSYLCFLKLLKNSAKVITDSGGVQKEAYFMGKPCITLRERTEWYETVEDGLNVLVGCDKDKIVNAINRFLPKGKPNLDKFGGGIAGKNIRLAIQQILGNVK